MTHENRSERTDARGAINHDGSQDFGCFQINNAAHPDFFENPDEWQDPVANAREALSIYEGRVNAGRIGWSAWYAVEGILW